MIELKQVSVGYSHKKKINQVVGNLNLKLQEGSLVALIGDNGSGKSTLIKTLSGILSPISGSVLIRGKDIRDYSADELSKMIAIVYTEKVIGFNLTAYDVVASGRIPYLKSLGILTHDDKQIVLNSLEKLSITQLSGVLMDELSDGQAQKVMIAKSLAQQTPIIILDEPTAFLDHTSKHQLFRTLKELSVKENKLIIISSHDLELLKQYTEQFIDLNQSSLSFDFSVR